MLFTPVVIALTAWQSLASAAAIEKAPEACVLASHVLALVETMDFLQANASASERIAFPSIPEMYFTEAQPCMPPALYDQFLDPVIKYSKENKLLEKFDDLMAQPLDQGTSQPRSLDVGLEKRIRNCPQMKDAALSQTHVYSCDSAPHPDKCRSCTNFISMNLLLGCLACAAKMNHESLFCCASTASVFATAYTQVCLSK
ncbi:hypothetical protein E4U09_003474 [Claviceps aff. purpurea]|uniref:Uncharacterized protein n=1 Tax=Claviceps aff. purpurea TaxID=1967640 RepID=A0A9P7QQA5_9HYPO|nr:hypothetical protein E4U35_008173 [Claviceps purpurea]KAG6302214.1 hypothetical protein E4U09_003474 [Claviceps aff. purpurea]